MSFRPAESESARAFDLFGTRVSLLAGEPLSDEGPSAEVALIQIEGFLRVMHRRLTRFDPDSELCALNAAGGREFEASGMLSAAVGGAAWAARRSDGLVDPLILDGLEKAGYRASRKDAVPAPMADALAAAPARRPARPADGAAWRGIAVDPARATVRLPGSARIDLGGVGKGLAADLGSERLGGFSTHAVDAGGDVRIGGEDPEPRLVRVRHPMREELAHQLQVRTGSVATSGISNRVWRTGDGYAHHLIDPSTGEPAWTGLVQATALAPTALEAETLAKMAFLSGPDGADAVLARLGGITVDEDGGVHLHGSAADDAVIDLGAAQAVEAAGAAA